MHSIMYRRNKKTRRACKCYIYLECSHFQQILTSKLGSYSILNYFIYFIHQLTIFPIFFWTTDNYAFCFRYDSHWNKLIETVLLVKIKFWIKFFNNRFTKICWFVLKYMKILARFLIENHNHQIIIVLFIFMYKTHLK